jgi:hypothetical protein
VNVSVGSTHAKPLGKCDFSESLTVNLDPELISVYGRVPVVSSTSSKTREPSTGGSIIGHTVKIQVSVIVSSVNLVRTIVSMQSGVLASKDTCLYRPSSTLATGFKHLNACCSSSEGSDQSYLPAASAHSRRVNCAALSKANLSPG